MVLKIPCRLGYGETGSSFSGRNFRQLELTSYTYSDTKWSFGGLTSKTDFFFFFLNGIVRRFTCIENLQRNKVDNSAGRSNVSKGRGGGGDWWAETDHFVLVYFLNFEYLEKESKAM